MYFTKKLNQPIGQMSFEQVLLGEKASFFPNNDRFTATYTKDYRQIPDDVYKLFDKAETINALLSFVGRNVEFVEAADKQSFYRTFYIKKHSGGVRRIDAPDDRLSEVQREFAAILRDNFGALYHTSAFAYVPGRSTKDAIQKHVKSNWFMKTDFHDFFGSTTPDFVIHILSQIFPFSIVLRDPVGGKVFKKALSIGFLNGGLPQGTPLSPMLTNLIMIPFDHYMFNRLAHKKMVYTRYADDCLFSCEQSFRTEDVMEIIQEALRKFQMPYHINAEKTRYGSIRGSNWNLGLMLNKERKITVGHEKKRYFKATVCNFIMDYLHGRPWSKEETARMQGLFAYYHAIEPNYFEYVIVHLNKKYSVNLMALMRRQLLS